MSFNNKRNSREDNSKRTPKRFSQSSGPKSNPSSRRSERNEYGKNRFSSTDEDQKKSNFGNRPSSSSNRGRSFDSGNKFGKDRKSFDKAGDRSYGDRPGNSGGKFDNTRGKSDDNQKKFDKPRNRFDNTRGKSDDTRKKFDNPHRKFDQPKDRSDNYRGKFEKKKARIEPADDGLIRLNRYIANAGISSRRKADELIVAGVVTVNGEVITELGTKVDPYKDEVRYNGERLKREKLVYVLLNKPKDYITTTDDPQERRTVMDLVAKASKERIYPVGRLDRNTTGLLLLTNDGNLSEKLSHPRNNISKLYYVELNKNLTQGDFNKISFGLELEDGFVKPDDLSYVQGSSKREVGIQIHSGKNRIVRRIFEHLGYDVLKLDRVVYANLTKKDLPRGRWRYLEEREVLQLKHLIK